MKALCVLLVIGALAFGYWYEHRPITYPPGVLIPSEPAQSPETDATPIPYHTFQLKPLAHFTVEARVLHRKIYRYDRQASLVPVDLALGWGPMSDQGVLDRLTISQSMRFYWYEYRLPPPIAPEEIVAHSTNLHVIPATDEVEQHCKALRAGTLVHLRGELVEATGPELGTGIWRSSLSRTDTGNGACELMWVEEVTELEVDRSVDQPTMARR
ncbi:MAG TPA: hypothetical protein VGG94_05750 [Chthoniobacterales bacterium]